MIKAVKAVVTAKPEKGLDEDLEVVINHDFPETLEDYVDKLGDEVVLGIINQQYTIKLQALMRGRMVSKDKDGNIQPSGQTAEEIEAAASTWVPGAPREKATTVEKLAKKAAKMSDDELEEFIAMVKAERGE